MNVKRIILMAAATLTLTAAMAQESSSYIVKTKGALKADGTKEGVAAGENGESAEDREPDFVRDNFKFYSMCDWQEGMKFMVMPEKYDLMVNTFVDAASGKEVGSGSLRHKIMIYQGHRVGTNGRERVYFHCQDNDRDYYFEIPTQTFDDYCYTIKGVPTLAYLGDVDIARTKLMGATVFTKVNTYYIDSSTSADAIEEITIPKNSECKVVAIGAGTRSFPVKIICALPNGKEFFQYVATSRTNCGMREDEFIMDKVKNTFDGSFQLKDQKTVKAGKYGSYIGKNVYTKYQTKMLNASGQKVTIKRLSNFVIKSIAGTDNNYVNLTLRSIRTGDTYTKLVTFVNDNVAGDIDGYKEDYFNYLFGIGSVNPGNISKSHWAAIQKGQALVGMSKNEVKLAKGDADKTFEGDNGRVDWVWNDGTIVKFGKNGKAFKVEKH